MFIKNLLKNLALFATLLLVACGGGGGGGEDRSVTYTGLTTPAVVTSANANTLAEGALGGSSTGTAFGVVSDEQEAQPTPTILDVARIFSNSVTQLDRSPSSSNLPGAIVSDSDTIDCLDGGRQSYNLRVDDVTADFSGTVDFDNCAEGGTTLNGSTNISGNLFSTIYMEFNPLSVVSGAENFTMSGKVTVTSSAVTMDVRARNNNTGLVEWLNNLTISLTDHFSFLEMSIMGRYYHPAHGYVDIVTNTPFQINYADQWPNVGTMTITGASGSKARVIAISNTQYTLDVDADGDDIYETSTLEDWG